jgi:hypothetical protein
MEILQYIFPFPLGTLEQVIEGGKMRKAAENSDILYNYNHTNNFVSILFPLPGL